MMRYWRNVADMDKRVAQQRALIAELQQDGRDAAKAELALKTLLKLREVRMKQWATLIRGRWDLEN
jgi:hypothetical protein